MITRSILPEESKTTVMMMMMMMMKGRRCYGKAMETTHLSKQPPLRVHGFNFTEQWLAVLLFPRSIAAVTSGILRGGSRLEASSEDVEVPGKEWLPQPPQESSAHD